MSDVIICTVALGHHYPRLIARMIEHFETVSPGFEIHAWVNALPLGADDTIVDGYDYTAYCAKPYALRDAVASGAKIAILLDAAFFPIKPIHLLVDRISQNGYYLCRSGNNVGEWSSDYALDFFEVDREKAFTIPEIASGIVGLDLTQPDCMSLLMAWIDSVGTFPGHHTNEASKADGRNRGLVSKDARVLGHRHDQTALSLAAHELGMDRLSEIGPDGDIWTYDGRHTGPTTLLLNRGGIA